MTKNDLKTAKTPKKLILRKIWKLLFELFRSLYPYRRCQKSVLGGQGSIKGVNNDDLLTKNTYFCYCWVILGIKPRINKFGRIWPLSCKSHFNIFT